MEHVPPSNSQRGAIACWILFSIGLGCLALLAWFIPYSRGQFVAIFQEFDVELPYFTILLLRIPSFVFPSAAFAIAIVMGIVQFAAPSRTTAAMFHIVVIALCVLTFIIYHVAVSGPLLKLIDGLSK